MAYKFIELEIKDYVATVTMARVESLNALNVEFASEIADVFRKLKNMDEARAIILQSKARIFCAGLDLKEAGGGIQMTPKGVLDWVEKGQSLFDCCNAIEECPKPVVAAIHGRCIGGGLDMACACDVRICTEDAIFCLKEAKMGLVADMGVLQRIPLIIGQGFAREMAFTAKDYSAREVEKMGLVNAVYADRGSLTAAAKKLAAEIAQNAPLALCSTKDVLNYSRYANVQDGMSMAIQKNMLLLMSDDLKEAINSFIERRPSAFKGK